VAAAVDPLGLGRALGQASRPKRPNILFVFSDEHRWCSLPFTEEPQVVAPNMTRLARAGMRLDNCCSTSAICIPYRGMLITGQWPHQSQCISNDYFENGDVIGVTSPTIAQTFKNAGFDTFQHWLYGDNHWETPVRDESTGEDFKPVKGYNAIGMTDQALDFIKASAKGERPWLMMLSLNPPHFRWDDAPEEFVKLYPQDKLTFRPNVTAERYKTGDDLRNYQHYHAHITAVDRELGRLMDELKKMGLEDDTIVIYTSDHGSSFGSNGVANKANPFDEAVRVPFLIRWPGHVPADKVADNLLGTIDLFPTLCGLAGIVPPKECGGQDFSPVMLGKVGPDPASQFLLVNNFQRNYDRTQLDPDGPNFVYPFRGVRTKRYTYAVYAKGEWLLYDNQKDPYQLKNLVNDPEYAPVKADLKKELDGWLAKAENPYIPAAWVALPLADRIATENRHYSLMPFRKKWDKFKADALAPYLARAKAGAQQEKLRAAADAVYDEAFFGRYKALDTEIRAAKRQTKRPLEELKTELAAHEAKAAASLKAEAEKILAGAG
jgi:arylsulfatase A-like enzyme